MHFGVGAWVLVSSEETGRRARAQKGGELASPTGIGYLCANTLNLRWTFVKGPDRFKPNQVV